MRMCPRCKTALQQHQYKGVQVDECRTCHGIFFDRGELERARDNTDQDLRWLDFVLFSIKDLQQLEQDQIDCPKCGFTMEALQYAGSSVIVSRCPDCQGVWLDHGEFQKIIAYLEKIVANQTADSLSDDVRQQIVDVLVGPKGEVEEVKDLLAVTRLFEERWVAEHPGFEKIIATYYELTPFK